MFLKFTILAILDNSSDSWRLSNVLLNSSWNSKSPTTNEKLSWLPKRNIHIPKTNFLTIKTEYPLSFLFSKICSIPPTKINYICTKIDVSCYLTMISMALFFLFLKKSHELYNNIPQAISSQRNWNDQSPNKNCLAHQIHTFTNANFYVDMLKVSFERI